MQPTHGGVRVVVERACSGSRQAEIAQSEASNRFGAIELCTRFFVLLLIDGILELEEGKLRVTLIKAVVKAAQRAKELAQG